MKLFKGRSKVDMELIYKASRDGFSSDDFHKNCDEKGATLTVIKSKGKEQVFGGYTSISWKRSNDPVEDNTAFVF